MKNLTGHVSKHKVYKLYQSYILNWHASKYKVLSYEFMCIVFICMPGESSVGDSGLCFDCVTYLSAN